MKKIISVVILVLLLAQISVYATQPTPPWERLNYSYHFTPAMDYRAELGQPTSFSGIVPTDVFTANVRVDANVALQPPSYGIFSGVIPTLPFSTLFPQPTNFWGGFGAGDLNTIAQFDTMQMGVNSQPLGHSINIQNVDGGGFLPPTSLH